jgi:U3 small nucleolar RNA-associated protein 15
LDSYKVTHASKYPAPILSMGLSPDCGLLAVGMADGNLSVRKHARPVGTGGDVTLSRAARNRGKIRLNASSYRCDPSTALADHPRPPSTPQSIHIV